MLEKVIHYFVVARILSVKDKRDTGRYRVFDCFSEKQAKEVLARQEKTYHTPFKIIKYEAMQKPVRLKIGKEIIKTYNSIYSIPQCVKDEYCKLIGSTKNDI